MEVAKLGLSMTVPKATLMGGCGVPEAIERITNIKWNWVVHLARMTTERHTHRPSDR